MSRGYQDLVAWQKSMDLVESVYHLTENFPKQETYGLTIQIRRATVSVRQQHCGRSSTLHQRRFLPLPAYFARFACGIGNAGADCGETEVCCPRT